MKNAPELDKFIASAPPIDTVREDAARCAEETAKWQRGERGPLRTPHHGLLSEFSDAAFGVAAEVAMEVARAMKSKRVRFTVDMPWNLAAALLRGGWQRGHRLLPHVIEKGGAS